LSQLYTFENLNEIVCYFVVKREHLYSILFFVNQIFEITKKTFPSTRKENKRK